MNAHIITKGDTGTLLDVTVGDKDGPVDLTGATVKFRWAIIGLVTEKTLTPDADQVENKGRSTAFWSDELANVAAGNYPCQVKATLSSGRIRYFPSKGYGTLTVQEPLMAL